MPTWHDFLLLNPFMTWNTLFESYLTWNALIESLHEKKYSHWILPDMKCSRWIPSWHEILSLNPYLTWNALIESRPDIKCTRWTTIWYESLLLNPYLVWITLIESLLGMKHFCWISLQSYLTWTGPGFPWGWTRVHASFRQSSGPRRAYQGWRIRPAACRQDPDYCGWTQSIPWIRT